MSALAQLGSTSRLVLLRHGRTAWNHERRAQGHAPVPLDDVGHQQAHRAARVLADLAPVRLWSSDIERAAQTAVYLAEATRLPVESDQRLREFSVGERQGLTYDEALERWPHLVGRSLIEQLTLVPGAESVDDVAARIVPAAQECLDALSPGETGVAVSHGAAIRVAVCGVLGWPLEQVESLGILRNCTWVSLVRRGEGKRPSLETYGGGDVALPLGIG